MPHLDFRIVHPVNPAVSRFAVRSLPLFALALGLAGCTPKGGGQPTVTTAPISYLDQIYVPGKDDKLHKHPVSHNAVDTQIKAGGNPTPALDEVIRAAPQYYPPEARVKGFKSDEKQFTVDLNAAFANQKFWSKGEQVTELAVYALVNSAAQVDKAGKKPVQLTVEGKPLSTLGEFDATDAIDPEPRFNAPEAGKPTAKPTEKNTA